MNFVYHFYVINSVRRKFLNPRDPSNPRPDSIPDHWRPQGSVPNGGKTTRAARVVTPERPVGCGKRRTDHSH